MRILRTVRELRAWRAQQSTLGMVPTMGALHQGHLDLVSRSLRDNMSTVMSIFVNPGQFAPTEDLDKYPRTFESDVEKFEQKASEFVADLRNQEIAESFASADNKNNRLAVFAPTVSEMYPAGIDLRLDHQRGTFVEVLGVSHQLEGKIRPQFFRGVATVVSKLLNAALPTKAYFGQKDIQQSVVVRSMVRDLLMPTEIVVCPTAREPNGLAMSSRNVYLTPADRDRASIIYQSLSKAREHAHKQSVSATEIQKFISSELLAATDLIKEVEYVSVNDVNTLENSDEARPGTVISVAVRLHKRLRLIDNVII